MKKSHIKWANEHKYQKRKIPYTKVICSGCGKPFQKETKYAKRSDKHYCNADCYHGYTKHRTESHEDIERRNSVTSLGSEMALIAQVIKSAISDLRATNDKKREDAEKFIFTEELDLFLEFFGIYSIETEYVRKLARR